MLGRFRFFRSVTVFSFFVGYFKPVRSSDSVFLNRGFRYGFRFFQTKFSFSSLSYAWTYIGHRSAYMYVRVNEWSDRVRERNENRLAETTEPECIERATKHARSHKIKHTSYCSNF